MISQLLSLAVVSILLYRFLRYRLPITDLHNIPGPPSTSWWAGNFGQVFNPDGWQFHADIAKKYGGIVRIDALFGEKMLYVFDPAALHQITIKEQHVFPKPEQTLSGTCLLFGEGVLGVAGEKHRKQRKLLGPVFSISHMREMTPIFYSVVHRLRNTLVKVTEDGPQEIDVLGYFSRTALELIGQSGLGYSFDSLEVGADEHPYAKTLKGLTPLIFKLFFFRTYVMQWAVKLGPPSFRRLLVNLTPSPTFHKLRDMIDFMQETSVVIYKEKKAALDAGGDALLEQIAQGKDLMSLLMRENMKVDEEDRMSEEDVISQMTTLIFAAMDTTSSALTRTLSTLAEHPQAQEQLRKEILAAQEEYGEDLPYDILANLPYLDSVCRETLRMFPPVSQILRECVKTGVLPLSKPIIGLNGKEMTEIVVPPGTTIMVSALASNRNPEVWGPDASEWKPERWLKGVPSQVSDIRVPGVYSNLMTFFGGSRSCLGFKFSQLEMKALLVHLVGSFKFEPSKEEIVWLMTDISSPMVKDVLKPQLPLIVTKL